MAKKKARYFIGIDLGGTKMLTGLLDKKFRIISAIKSKVDTSKGEKYFLSTVKEHIEELLDECDVKIKDIKAIGIGCPGTIQNPEGVVVFSPNIPFLKKYPLKDKLKKIFRVPVAVENDVNAGLYGEQQFGAAKGYSNVIGFFLGTGVGGALILDNKLYHGASGAAGEVGHIIVDPEGPLCGCGMRGCLEALTGRTAIASEAAMLALRQKAPTLYEIAGTDIAKIKSNALATAIKKGDTAIRDLILYKARILGRAMASMVNVLSPDLVVLGGGLVEAMESLIVKEAEKTMHEYAMWPIAKYVKVVGAELKDYAIVKGAAKLVAASIEK